MVAVVISSRDTKESDAVLRLLHCQAEREEHKQLQHAGLQTFLHVAACSFVIELSA